MDRPQRAVVYLVAPPKSTPEQKRLQRETQRAAEDRGLDWFVFRTRAVRSQDRNESHRPLEIIEPWDAEKLYREAHRRPVAVFPMGSPRVLRSPARAPSSKQTMSLEAFAKHKLFFARLNDRVSPIDLVESFQAWTAIAGCHSDRDARCLPMHVFAPSHNHESCELTDNSAFEALYGSPTNLRDSSGRPWNRPNGANHGQEALRIAGYELQAGFHWDVEGRRGSGQLVTSTEIWDVPTSAYVNVYPDAYVRGGQSINSAARRIHKTERPSQILAPGQSGPQISRTAGRGQRRR